MEFKKHVIDLYIDHCDNMWGYEAFEGEGPNSTVCYGDGYVSYECAEKAAYRDLTCKYGNRFEVKYC